jgi:hypothetical protein
MCEIEQLFDHRISSILGKPIEDSKFDGFVEFWDSSDARIATTVRSNDTEDKKTLYCFT